MNTLMNMDPWGFLDDLLDTGSKTLRSMRARAAGRFPPVNVYLDEDAALIDLELPGKSAKDVDLTLEPQAVIIAGARSERPEAKGQTEDCSNSTVQPSASNLQPLWSRRLELPFRIDAEKANARFTNGILRIELPRADATGVKKIAIQ